MQPSTHSTSAAACAPAPNAPRRGRSVGGLQASQRGFSLMIVLMILIIASIVGIVGAQVAIMGERGSRNDRDAQVATQAAETTLADAEFDILGAGTGTSARASAFATGNQMAFVAGCGNTGNSKGLCLPSAAGKPVWLDIDLSSTRTAEFGEFTGRSFAANTSGLTSVMPAQAPRYLIEAVPDTSTYGDARIGAAKRFVYRVTAIGYGPRTDIQTIVQMLYRKP
ncbi:conserved hypothetical protein [Burkholderiales bacterium 8X]|nr:conserved hypothetical protein [Burkholderiales bacterium 8X]